MSKLNMFQKIIVGVIVFFVVIGILLKVISGSLNANLGYDGISMLKYALIDYPTKTVKDWMSDFATLWSVKEENDLLHYELSQNPSYKAKAEELAKQNEELRKALEIKTEDTRFERKFANVLTRDASSWNNLITIDLGSSDGVEKDMAVESVDGMIGTIQSVGTYTSTVKLLTSQDGQSKPPVKINLDKNTSSEGILQSYDVAKGMYVIFLFDDNDEIEKGMQVVTSGKGGVYPSGLLIGTVDSVQALSNQVGQTIYVKPIENFQTFDFVSVIVNAQENK